MIRRKFLTRLALTSSGILVGGTRNLKAGSVASTKSKKDTIQLVHITDSHVFEEKNCLEYSRLFLEELSSKAPKPDMIFHTGDIIMDALEANRASVKKQWKLWQDLALQLSVKPHYAMGNHDIWGSGPKTDPLYGKKWAIDELEIENRFYTFQKGKWKFIMLDSTQMINGNWYTARIDDTQREWLKGELDSTSKSTYVMIVSHIPILSACIFEWAKSENGLWTVQNSLMRADSHAVQAILREYPQVKLCINGHLHMRDKVSYDGIDYLGTGAVSGNWWANDTFHQTQCGFGIFDLNPDGSYQRTYYTYKWT